VDTATGNRYIDSPGGLSGRGLIVPEPSGKLKAPDNIIMTVSAARTYWNQARMDHLDRIYLASQIIGLVGGNPPFDQEELAKAGLDHVTNANFLDAKALIERSALTLWNLINNNSYLIKFEIRPYQSQQDQDYTTWAETMSRKWTEVILEEWPDFSTEYATMALQLVMLGLSPIVFDDENSFKWESVDYARFYVPNNTLSNAGKWDYVAMDTPYQMSYLWGVYNVLSQKSKEEQDKAPWNIDALERFLLLRANNIAKTNGWSGYPFGNLVDLQTGFQNGNLNSAMVFSDTVPLSGLLYREYDRKISKYIFDPTIGTTGDEFLYKVTGQYESFQEAVVAFTYSAGERYIHGNRGVGQKIYPACQAVMQLDCSTVDMGKMAATPVIESPSALGQSMDPVKFIPGVATNIGSAKLAQNNLGSNTGQVIQIAQHFERKIARNAQMSGDDTTIPDQDKGSKSPDEVKIQNVKEFAVGKQTVMHFYKFMDITLKQMVIKMYHCPKDHPDYPVFERWKEECMDEGVPEEMFMKNGAKKGELPKHLRVKAARVAGDGSSLGLQMGLRSVAGIAGGFSAKGQYNYRADIINSGLGADYVQRYLGDATVPDEALGGASLARLENVIVKQGEMPQAEKDNQHKAHIGSHMADAMGVVKAIQAQEMDPAQADGYFSLMLPHIGEHIKYIEEDSLNAQYIEELTPSIRQLQKFAQLNRVRAQKMQQAELRRRAQEEEAATAMEMEQNRKDMQAQREEQRKDFKTGSQVERAKEANQTRADIMKRSVEAKAENERLAVRLKADNEAEKNRIQQPKEIFASQTTEQIQADLRNSVGTTPNPADFI
jgi:hypothetical protein